MEERATSATGGLVLRMQSRPADVGPIRRQVEAWAESLGWDEQVRCELGLCINEALANVIRHAYQGRDGNPIEIALLGQPDALEVRIRDWGNGINPELESPQPYDPLVPGGVGLMCLRELMDEVSFRPQERGMLLLMRRHKGRRGPRLESPSLARGPEADKMSVGATDVAWKRSQSEDDAAPEALAGARASGDAVIATVRGEVDLNNSPPLRNALLALVRRHAPRRLVLDLKDVSYMDSSAIAVLVELLREMRKTGGRVFLAALQPRVRGLLEIARLDTIFSIVADEKEALGQ